MGGCCSSRDGETSFLADEYTRVERELGMEEIPLGAFKQVLEEEEAKGG